MYGPAHVFFRTVDGAWTMLFSNEIDLGDSPKFGCTKIWSGYMLTLWDPWHVFY